MMVYHGIRGFKTVNGSVFVPALKRAAVFPSVALAVTAIDEAISMGRVAPVTNSANLGAVNTEGRSGKTRMVGEAGPTRRAVGIVQNDPGRGEAERLASDRKEAKRKSRRMSFIRSVLDTLMIAGILFLVVFIALVAADLIRP